MARRIGLNGITRRLKEMGVTSYVLDLVKEGVKHPDAPDIGRDVIARLKETVQANENKAVLVLSKQGEYRVFSVSGHEALRKNAKKNKPWEAATKLRVKNSKKK